MRTRRDDHAAADCGVLPGKAARVMSESTERTPAPPRPAATAVVLILIFRRWRHLVVFLGSLFFLEIVGGQVIYNGLTRPRPYGVLIIGSWAGYSAPSIPVAAVTLFLVGAVYGLVVAGPTRVAYGKAAAAAVIAVFGLARLYLAVDHPDDVLFGVALGVAVPVAALVIFTPNAIFPVVFTAGAGPPTSMSARPGAATRSGWPCTTSSG